MSRPGPTLLLSTRRNPASNLAFEEFLLKRPVPQGGILLFYENDPAVVIGRYQNPWLECVPGRARESGIPVLRRISGGGTVVHGPGNLNFSVITENPPDPAANLGRIVRAFERLGIEARTADGNDLVVRTDRERKVSGSAFRRTSRASMHHGTLLVNADIRRIRSLLRREGRDMDARGVASRPSPMANLSDLKPGLTVGETIRALIGEWGGGNPETVDPMERAGDPAFDEALSRLGSWEWNYGKTPDFIERFSGLRGYQGGSFALRVRRGRIFEAPGDAGFLIGAAYRGAEVIGAAGDDAPDWIRELAPRIDGA